MKETLKEIMKDKKKVLVVALMLMVLVGLGTFTYAYFSSNVNNDNNTKVTIQTGEIKLELRDPSGVGLNIIERTLGLNESVTKDLVLENTGTVRATAQIYWNELVNTYMNETLSLELYESVSTDGVYGEYKKIEAFSNNVPYRDTSSVIPLSKGIELEPEEERHYRVKITLVDNPSINQSKDFDATLKTGFTIKEGTYKPVTDDIIAQASNETPDFSLAAGGAEGNSITSSEPYSNINIISNTDFLYNEETKVFTSQNHQDSTTAEVTLNVQEPANLYACYGITSQAAYDKGSIYLNDEQKFISSVNGTGCISLGDVTNADVIKFNYAKDAITSTDSDTVEFVLTTNESSLIESTKNFSFGESGIYAMADEDGTSYYYRGDVNNNYVRFGKFPEELYRGYNSDTSKANYREYRTLEDCQNASANNVNCEVSPNAGKDMWWRIIRINGNGTIRMIYDGIRAHANGEKSDDRVALYGVKYNANGDNKYVGYMYGGLEGVESTSKDQAQANETDSNIKKELENWYEIVLANTSYENYISDEVFCNDRSIPNITNNTEISGHAKNATYYGAYDRATDTFLPTFRCDMNTIIDTKNDKFTISADKGNGKLKYPVGLITADEIMAAGGKRSTSNENYYLHRGESYISISPYRNYGTSNTFTIVPFVSGKGSVQVTGILATIAKIRGVVPVINLNADISKTLLGTGTMTDPYRID